MKQTTKMSRAVSQLEHIYNSLNTDFFAGELPTPIITVQSKPGTYGHCTTSKVWQRKDGGAYELNIAAEVLNYPLEEIIDTLLHESTHIFCREHGIKEVSRGGKYHNKKFKECFHIKAKMLTPEEVYEYTGHHIGGVCPFGIRDGVQVYLDESLKRFETVFPAVGSANSAVELTIPELELCSEADGWVDVCKDVG